MRMGRVTGVRTMIAASAIVSTLWSGGAPAQELDTPALISALKAGGHVIYIRHASTESDYADQVTADPNNCATQRVLSEKGWRQAREIGAAFQRLAIPVGPVTSSEFCRAWKTADLAFGKYEKTSLLNFEKAEEYTDEQFAAMRDRVTPMLVAKAPASANTVIVGHDDPFEAATGIYPEPQGVTYVLKPDGNGGFSILGHINPDAWPGG